MSSLDNAFLQLLTAYSGLCIFDVLVARDSRIDISGNYQSQEVSPKTKQERKNTKEVSEIVIEMAAKNLGDWQADEGNEEENLSRIINR